MPTFHGSSSAITHILFDQPRKYTGETVADIQLIISSLRTIANAVYQGPASSRKTLAHEAFDRLQGSAKQVADILTQNPQPTSDQKENLQAQFNTMQSNVEAYVPKRTGVEDIISAWNKAKFEWDLLVAGK